MCVYIYGFIRMYHLPDIIPYMQIKSKQQYETIQEMSDRNMTRTSRRLQTVVLLTHLQWVTRFVHVILYTIVYIIFFIQKHISMPI